MNRRLTVGLSALCLLTACTDSHTIPTDLAQNLIASGADAPARTWDEGGNWTEMPAEELWTVIAHAGGEAHVGLKSPGRRRGIHNGVRLISSTEEVQGRQAVRAIAGVSLIQQDNRVPAMRVRISGPEVIERLRRLPFVDYLEPAVLPQEAGFAGAPTAVSDALSGCAYTSHTPQMYVAPGDVGSLNYIQMMIPDAWRRSRGRGVVIGLTDTGLSEFQPELLSDFATGLSTGRTVTPISTRGPTFEQAGGAGMARDV
jgi:serine protease